MQSAHPKILLASPDPKERKILSRYLRGRDYSVTYAKDRETCLNRLRKKPDLLLLHVSMDHSRQILKAAKMKGNGGGMGHGIPVVVFDPNNNPLRELKALRLGADGYVGRPHLREELISTIVPFVGQEEREKRFETDLRKEIQKRESVEQEFKRLSFFVDKITSNMPVSIVIVDQDKKIVYANRNFCRVQAWEERDLLGMPLERLFPESVYGPIGFLENVEQVLRQRRSIPRFGMQYRGDFYTCRIVPTRGKRHLETGLASTHAMILIENVSELRKMGEKVKLTEEKYRALFESAPDGIVVARPGGGRILDANRRVERLFGLKRSLLRQRAFLRFYSPGERSIVKKRFEQETACVPAELPELVMTNRDGTRKILAVTAAPIIHRGEKALLCLLKDITEKRLLEDQVRQGEKMSFLGQFTAGAAHEINNPLSIISSHCQYLLSRLGEIRKPGSAREVSKKALMRRFFSSPAKKGERDRKDDPLAEVHDTLNLIDRESRHCGRIIQNLLAFTHTREANRKPVNIADVVDETLKMVAHQLALSNIKVATEIDEPSLFVLGDANLLQQVLMNLIWNAQAAMPKRGKLTVRVDRGGNGTMALSVGDTGCGIPEENMEKIFTPFFTTKEVGKGTGLGLWVVRSIVEEHQGKIGVKSRMGKGTVFTVNLPHVAPEALPKTNDHS